MFYRNGILSKKEIVREASKATGYSRSDIEVVIDCMIDIIEDNIINGYNIKLGDVGIHQRFRKPFAQKNCSGRIKEYARNSGRLLIDEDGEEKFISNRGRLLTVSLYGETELKFDDYTKRNIHKSAEEDLNYLKETKRAPKKKMKPGTMETYKDGIVSIGLTKKALVNKK